MLNAGMKHISSKGKTVPERTMKGPCKCRMKCYERIPEETRISIFRSYWELGDINRQRDYILQQVSQAKKKTF